MVIVSFSLSSCVRIFLDIYDSIFGPVILPEADTTTFWYELHYERDTIWASVPEDTTHICNIIEYDKPAEANPHYVTNHYEFGFNHLVDSSGFQHATFNFYICDLNYLSGKLISDTSFFEEGKKYYYTSVDNKHSTTHFSHSNTPAFWFAFHEHEMDNDTAYTLSFEFDYLKYKRDSNNLIIYDAFDTLRIRNGSLSVSRKYEDYVLQNHDKLNYYYQGSDGFIK